MRLMVVGGGTAGHVLPAVPVMRSLLDAGWEVTFVGTRSGLEARLIAHLPVQFIGIAAGKLRRYWSWQNLTDLLRTFGGVMQSVYHVRRVRPDVIFAKGGFVSFPVALAGWLWRVPIVAHESDLTPGLANKLVLPFIQTLCVSFAATADGLKRKNLKVVHTGTPIRDAMLEGNASAGRERLGISEREPLLVVTGGSLGADALNAAVRDALDDLVQEFTVLHVCGPGKLAEIAHPRYQQVEYIAEGWGDTLAAADVVVSRAGANALFELLALRKLALLVPLSTRASRGDQIQNAGFAAAHGLCEVLAEADLTARSLVAAIRALQANRPRLQEALARFEVPPAADLIVAEIIAAAEAAA